MWAADKDTTNNTALLLNTTSQNELEVQNEGNLQTAPRIEIITEVVESSSESEGEGARSPEGTEARSKLGAMELIILVYFWTCGGPYGIEDAVGSGGAALTALSIIIICIFWALPQALMAAELSLMISVNGGNIVWVQDAFGDFLGFFNAGCFLACSLSSQALQIILFTDYIKNIGVLLPLPVVWAIRVSFVLICTVANTWGVKWFSRLSWVILVIVFLPFLLQMYLTYFQSVPVAPLERLIDIPPFGEVSWGTLISTSVWALGGFDAVGAIAGEVTPKTFILGVLGAFPLCFFNYLLPIFASYLVSSYWQNWATGYFPLILKMFFPHAQWLSVFMVVAASIANFAQLTTSMSSVSWTIWAMGKGRKNQIALHRYLPYFVSWSWIRSKSGTERPIFAILINSVLSLLVSILNFSFVVNMYLLVRIANLVCEYAALIRLKQRDPERKRPFAIPGGVPGALLLSAPSLAIAVLALEQGIEEDYTVALYGGSTLAVIAICYPLKLLWVYLTHKLYHLLSQVAN